MVLTVLWPKDSLTQSPNLPFISQECPKSKSKKNLILFCKILRNEWYHAKVLLKRFHLNDHTEDFVDRLKSNMSP